MHTAVKIIVSNMPGAMTLVGLALSRLLKALMIP